MSDFIDLPATSDQQKTASIGIHKMTIIKIEKAVDKQGQAILDNRNYPALKIHFKTEDGEFIESIFHYSQKPQNDPSRTDPALACKSEFRLNNLKRALGFGAEPVKSDQIKSKLFYGMVYGELWVHEENKKMPVLRNPEDPESKIIFNRLGSIFWPDNPVRPVKDGDPKNPNSNGIPSGDFLRPSAKSQAEVSKFLAGKDSPGKQAPASQQDFKDDFDGAGAKESAGETEQSTAIPNEPSTENADW
jgi:hypothetical protein